MLILGLETSCDETGVALYDERLGVLAQALHSQVGMHRDYGGVVPELASRDHIRRTLPLVDTVLASAQRRRLDIDAIAVTVGPGLSGALLVGVGIAHALGYALRRPVVGVHHREGHLLSARLAEPAPDWPFVALLVSGGHTQLLRADAPGRYASLGETLDDAAGEAFDKVAQLLGLGYPGGPAVSDLAETGTAGRVVLPRPLLRSASLDFSFSGLKTAVANAMLRDSGVAGFRADLARGFVDAVVEVLTAKALAAVARTGVARLVVAGGVSANRQLRRALGAACSARGIALHFPPPALCTDNGVMIALAGSVALGRGVQPRPGLGFSVRPRWALADLDTWT